jgi:hypothetical protein
LKKFIEQEALVNVLVEKGLTGRKELHKEGDKLQKKHLKGED